MTTEAGEHRSESIVVTPEAGKHNGVRACCRGDPRSGGTPMRAVVVAPETGEHGSERVVVTPEAGEHQDVLTS